MADLCRRFRGSLLICDAPTAARNAFNNPQCVVSPTKKVTHPLASNTDGVLTTSLDLPMRNRPHARVAALEPFGRAVGGVVLDETLNLNRTASVET